MKELNRIVTKEAQEESVRKDQLDDNTREVVDEYSRKFLAFMQQEKDRARKSALSESEKIIAEAEKKGHQTYEKAIHDAAFEAENIIARSLDAVKRIATDADKLVKATNEVKEKTEKQIANARAELQQQSAVILEFYRKQEKALSETGDKLKLELDTSSSLLANLKQEIEKTSKTTRIITPSQPEEPPAAPVKYKMNHEEPINRPQPVHEEPIKRQSEKTYVGTINLDVYRKNPALSKRFKESLAKVPSLEISLVDDSAKDKAKIVAYTDHPLPLLSILHQMSLVRSAVSDDDVIKITLQEGDTWVG